MSDTPNKDINMPEESAEQNAVQPPVDLENSTVFGKPEDLGRKKEKSSKPWVKRVVAIAIIVVFAAVMVCGKFAIDKFFPDEGDTDPTSSEYTGIALSNLDAEKVVSFEMTMGEEKVEAALEGTTWKIRGIDPSITDSNMVKYRVEDLCKVSASREMDAQGDYGIENPRMILKASSENGDFVLTVGKVSPDGSGYYCTASPMGDRVFLVDFSTIDLFSGGVLAFVEKDAIRPLAKNDTNADYFKGDSGSLNMFDSIEISGSRIDGSIKLAMTNDESKFNIYSLSSPITAFADDETVTEILSPVADGISVVETVSIDYPADREKYGLDAPDYDVKYKIGDYYERVTLSKANGDGLCYMALGDEPKAIYSVYTSMLPYEGLTVTGLYTPYPFFENIKTVSSIWVESPDGTYDYKLTHKEDDDNTETNLSVTCNGKKVDTTAFRTFYQDLVKLSAISFTTEKQSGDARITIKVGFLGEGAKDTVLTLVRVSDMRYHISVNGTPYGICPSEGVKLILDDCQKLLSKGNLE